jgi:hypothetical protein
MIPHSRPRFDDACLAEVGRTIASGHTAMGEEAAHLEAEVSTLLQRSHAVAVDSGTSGLMLALRALAEMRPVTRVGIPAYGCASLLHAVRAAGATPVCMDCDASLRLDGEAAMAAAEALDAVILVHPFGMVEPLAAQSWPCPVIEDIAQAPGAQLAGRPVGAFGSLTVSSFYATKPWGGAYGGMVLANDPAMTERIMAMRDPDRAAPEISYAGHHQLSDLHATLARCRMQQADDEAEQRRLRAMQMDGWFADVDAEPVADLHASNHYRYIVRVDGSAAESVAALHAEGVGAARPVSRPLHHATGDTCPGAEQAWKTCLSLPLLADASEMEMQQIQQAVQKCL